MVPILSAQNVSKHFRGLEALSGVDFQVAEGSITSVIGPNGAGKTTLFNVIAGNQAPNGGQIRFRERVISGLAPNSICRLGIARTYQNVRPFLGLSVWNNVKVALLFGRREPLPSARVDAEIESVLEFAQLTAHPARKAETLTPLERKRLEIARALATDPEVMLLDEIVAGLSPAEALQMMETIRVLNGRGITILLIEHVMKAVMGLSSHIIVLHHGVKIAEGAPKDIARDQEVIRAYLGDAGEEG
ncbi:MAG: ABC transporter ATP-binding protein [SAR324 cluster bacterium]|nr:ABC transporter ATP-binding protein [SAR324 cluster bacterium]